MPCLNDNEIAALAEGGQHWDQVQQHLDSCDACRTTLALASRVAVRDSVQVLDAPPTLPQKGLVLLTEGQRVADRYRIDRELGRGGMGVVYRAWDERLARAVALKVARGTSASYRQHLVSEARAMAAVSHPRLVTVHDVGEHEDVVYLAMELLDGTPLVAFRADAATLVRLAIEVGSALSALHAAGVVHRDVKPSNILVEKNGHARLLDLGLAKEEGAVERSVAGTPGYMAPEQADGQRVGPLADQYSFALTFLTLLGEPGPHGPSPLTADGVAPPRARRALQRAIATAPSDRFPSMDALLVELSARPLAWLKPAAIALGVLLVVGGLVIGPPLLRRRACERRRELVTAVWNPATRASLEASITTAGLSSPPEVITETLELVDRRASALAEREVAVCLDEAAGAGSARQTLAVKACLEESLGALRGAVTAFRHPTSRTVQVLPSLVRQLPTAEQCASRDAELSDDAWSLDARARIAELEARARMGEFDDAIGGLASLAAEAQQHSQPAIEVTAELTRVRLLERAAKDTEKTFDDVRAAVRVAEAHALDRLAFLGRLQLAELFVRTRTEATAAKNALDDARAALARLGSPAVEAASFELVEAWFLADRGQGTRALELYGSALGRCDVAPCSPQLVSRLLAGRASLMAQLDPSVAAVAVAKKATDFIETTYGPRSIELFEPLVQQGKVAIIAEQWAEAVACFDRALRLSDDYQLQPTGLHALAYGMRGIAEHELLRTAASRSDLELAQSLQAQLVGIDPMQVILNETYLALLDLEDQRPEAVEKARKAVATARTHFPEIDDATALPSIVLGLALGDTPEGRHTFEAARAVFAHQNDASTLRWIDQQRMRRWGR